MLVWARSGPMMGPAPAVPILSHHQVAPSHPMILGSHQWRKLHPWWQRLSKLSKTGSLGDRLEAQSWDFSLSWGSGTDGGEGTKTAQVLWTLWRLQLLGETDLHKMTAQYFIFYSRPFSLTSCFWPCLLSKERCTGSPDVRKCEVLAPAESRKSRDSLLFNLLINYEMV